MLPDLEEDDLEQLSARGFTVDRVIADGVHTRIYMFYKTDEENENPSKALACKVADSNKMPKTVFTKFFKRELEMLAKINHPNIINIHSVLQLSHKYFIFMRYAEMGDLGNYLSCKGYLKEKQARAWTRQLASALLYLHTLAIAHRDVKCDNILITGNLNVKLTDFGFSRLIVDTKGKEVHSGTFCGSLSYAAPEVIRGTKYYPRVADVWSLGVVLFTMMNGFLPFKADNTSRLYADQLARNFFMRRDLVVSTGVKETIAWLLEPEPSNRMSLEALLRSRWMRVIPKYRQLTDKELDALQVAKIARHQLNQKKDQLSCPPSNVNIDDQ